MRQNWWETDPPAAPNGYIPPATGPFAPGASNLGLQPPGDTPDGIFDPVRRTFTPRDPTPRPGQQFSPEFGYWRTTAAPTAPVQPPTTGGPGGPSSTGAFPGSSPTSFDWPTFTGPTFNPPGYSAPRPFEFPAFQAPSLEDAQNQPGYQFGLKQGLGAMTNSRAAQGIFRTGGSPKAFFDYANAAAEQNYGNVFNQAKDTYQTNAANAANVYGTNYQAGRDTFNTAYQTAKDTYDSQFQNASAAFNPLFQSKQLTFQDLYQRWLAGLDATTKIATAGV